MVTPACFPSPADRPRYLTAGSSEQSGHVLIRPPARSFAGEVGLKGAPQETQSRMLFSNSLLNQWVRTGLNCQHHRLKGEYSTN